MSELTELQRENILLIKKELQIITDRMNKVMQVTGDEDNFYDTLWEVQGRINKVNDLLLDIL